MIKLYDTVKIKESNMLAVVIEIDDNNGKDIPIYLVEIIDKPLCAKPEDVIKWLEYFEIEKI